MESKGCLGKMLKFYNSLLKFLAKVKLGVCDTK